MNLPINKCYVFYSALSCTIRSWSDICESDTILVNLLKVLWLSRFFSNYQFVSFGGCFWIFGGSNNLDSMFLFSCHCTVSLSAVIVNKKNQGAALGTAAGCRGIFCLYFSDTTLLPALLQKRMKYVNVILFRIACYTIKIQNCPPKDIFKKFERKAHNHSTLI